MSGDGKFFVGIIVAAVLAVGAFVIFSGNSGSNSVNVEAGDAYKIGPDSAKVKIIAFEDFQCPACRAAEGPINEMLEANKDKVQFVFRHFPLPGHANAEESALAAEAAGALGKFWEMKKLLYETQDEWSNLQNPDNFFGTLASQLKLDLGKFRDGYRSNTAKDRIKNDLEAGQKANVNQTPTFFVNGKLEPGVKTAEQWQDLIDAAIAEADKPKAE